jgi:cell wall-associated NlpC family hydrolase
MQLVVAAVASAGAAALLVPTLASASPGRPVAATPDVAAVQQQLGALALRNTQLVEKYNQAQVQVAAKQKVANAGARKAAKLKVQYERARLVLSQTVAAQYEGGAFSATGALLSSSNGESYLDQLNTMSIVSAHTAQILTQLSKSRAAVTSAQRHAAGLLATAKAKRNALDKQKTSVQHQIDKYTTLLATLNSDQRDAYERAMNPAVPAATAKVPPGVSGKAKVAVQFALAQVGKPYVFGAAGPGSYDCSGLTEAAWAAAGVGLPHSAADQYNYGTHVSPTTDQLAPGDLVFFYSPIGHVTIYIGNGMMVSAPQEGENVSVVPLSAFNGSITGATRLS